MLCNLGPLAHVQVEQPDGTTLTIFCILVEAWSKSTAVKEDPSRVLLSLSFQERKTRPSPSRFLSTSPTRNCRASCLPRNPKPFVNKYHNPCSKPSGSLSPKAPEAYNLSSSCGLRQLARLGKLPLPRYFNCLFLASVTCFVMSHAHAGHSISDAW